MDFSRMDIQLSIMGTYESRFLKESIDKVYDKDPKEDPQRFITTIVLIAGVIGGLVVVISVILFCKYCMKGKKVLKRQPVIFKRESPERSYRGFKLYESVESTTSTDGGSVIHTDISILKSTPCKTQAEQRQESKEDLEFTNEIDAAVFKYKRSLRGDELPPDPATLQIIDEKRERFPNVRETSQLSPSQDGATRHVSFMLNEKGQPKLTASRSLSISRYTEGDFHHLKKAKINRSAAVVKIAKQRSLGSSGIELTYSSSILEDPSSTEGDITETTPMLSPVAEEPQPGGSGTHLQGPRPHSPGAVYRTEVCAEVHRNPNGSQPDAHAASVPRVSVPAPRAAPSIPRAAPSAPRVGALSPRAGTSTTRPGALSPRAGTSTPRVLPPRPGPVPGDIREHLLVPRGLRLTHNKRAVSMDTGSRPERKDDSRRAYSYDVSEGDYFRVKPPRMLPSGVDYNRLAITQFNRGPFYSADYDLVSEGGGSPKLRPKVSYNDTGSVEEVNEDEAPVLLDEVIMDDMNFDESDTDTVNGAHKYRELWNLRATLEEEEEFSDTIRMEDMTSPDEERDVITTSHTTSFESNTEPVAKTEPRSDADSSDETVVRKYSPGGALQIPSSENRRQTYRSILSKRLKRIDAPQTNTENSFDSVETMETDGDVSDTSRQDMTTTSFESTTDNTDSTGEGNSHKLQQMRGDSGYKSLETQQSSQGAGLISKPAKKQIHFVLDNETGSERGERLNPTPSPEDPFQASGASPSEIHLEALTGRRSSLTVKPSKTHFERRNGKTASKKRREYRSERQIIQVHESVNNEPETDSRSDHGPSGDSFDESPRKLSLFSRFLKARSHDSGCKRSPPVVRDFSMDEQTNALFNEFNRHDPALDHKQSSLNVRRVSPRIRHIHRLHRKHSTDATGSFDLMSRTRRERLSPSMRSASLGSDSSMGSGIRRLSPQDSIEEEILSRGEGEGQWVESESTLLAGNNTSIAEIPIIRLPEEETSV